LEVDSLKEWLAAHGDFFWEMTNLKTADTSHIHLEPTGEDFDEEAAEEECRNRVERNFDYSSYYQEEGVYDSYDDDPDFNGVTIDQWEDDHPRPDGEDYETDEEFEKALEDWKEALKKAEEDYDDAVSKWERQNERRRELADERASEHQLEEIQDCVAEQERYHSRNSTKGFKYEFSHGDKDFEVTMDQDDHTLYGQHIPNVYSIAFRGPEGYSSTGASGSEGSKIYSQLVLAAKKLVEEHEVNGLYFTPAEPGMRIVYTRFYNTFMKDDFIRVETDLYVRREFVKEAFEKAKARNPELAKDMLQGIADAHRKNRSLVDQAKLMKNEKRFASKLGSYLVNQFVPVFGQTSPVFITGFDAANGKFSLVNPVVYSNFRNITLPFYSIALPWSKLSPVDLQKNLFNSIKNFDLKDPNLYPFAANPEAQRYLPQPWPALSQFETEVKNLLDFVKTIYDNPMYGYGQTNRQYFHGQLPRSAEAFEKISKQMGSPLDVAQQAHVAPEEPKEPENIQQRPFIHPEEPQPQAQQQPVAAPQAPSTQPAFTTSIPSKRTIDQTRSPSAGVAAVQDNTNQPSQLDWGRLRR
jgi:hypothetical protein